MEFVLLNPCVFFSLGHCIACPSAIYDWYLAMNIKQAITNSTLIETNETHSG
jgi:hypothetical protein